MKAKITDRVRHNGRNYGGEKETIERHTAVVVKDGKPLPAVRVVWYQGRSRSANRVYCTVWANGGKYNMSVSGTGYVDGHQYHKESAAMAEALASAGIELDQGISGCGEMATREAMAAIVRAMGYRGAIEIV